MTGILVLASGLIAIALVWLGARRRRPRLLALGLACLACSVVVAGLSIGTTDLYEVAPVWVLRRGVQNEKPDVVRRSLRELVRRQRAGALTPRHLGAIVHDGLDVLDDLSGTWDPAWDELFAAAQSQECVDAAHVARFVTLADRVLDTQADRGQPWSDDVAARLEAGWRLGALNDARVQRYLAQGVAAGLALTARPRVRASAGVPVRVRLGDFRFSSALLADEPPAGLPRLIADWRFDAASAGGTVTPIALAGTVRVGADRAEQDGWLDVSVPVGTHSITCTGVLVVRAITPTGESVRAESAIDRQAEVEVVPASETVVEGDGALAGAETVRDSIVLALHGPRWLRTGRWMEAPAIGVRAAPCDLALEVLIGVGDQAAPVGSIAIARGATGHAVLDLDSPMPPGPVDVIVRSSLAVAERTVDLERVWAGTLTWTTIGRAPYDTASTSEREATLREHVGVWANATPRGAGHRISIEVDIARPPVDVAFRVSCRYDGGECPVGWIACRAGGQPVRSGPWRCDTSVPVDVVDIVLRPATAAIGPVEPSARRWNETITFEDVAVREERQRP